MLVQEILEREPILLAEGSMFDRLKREAGELFDPSLDHLGLVFSDKGRESLLSIYTEYIKVGLDSDLPIVVFTPTWRGNKERVQASKFCSENVNLEGAQLVTSLRDKLQKDVGNILVGGLIGCKGDCYSPDQALSSSESHSFHVTQIEVLSASQIDLLFASTLPAVSEALGIAMAMSSTNHPYMLSFVVDQTGCVLDGIPLGEAIEKIDSLVEKIPVGYMVNCVHPSVFAQGLKGQLKSFPALRERLVGIQGNTSRRSASEFDTLGELETESPDDFANATLELHSDFGLQILGGCCGTGTEHIAAIAQKARGAL